MLHGEVLTEFSYGDIDISIFILEPSKTGLAQAKVSVVVWSLWGLLAGQGRKAAYLLKGWGLVGERNSF